MSRRAEGTVDQAATAWICGVFLYCMLCNQYPVCACSGRACGLCSCSFVPVAFLPDLQINDSVCISFVFFYSSAAGCLHGMLYSLHIAATVMIYQRGANRRAVRRREQRSGCAGRPGTHDEG